MLRQHWAAEVNRRPSEFTCCGCGRHDYFNGATSNRWSRHGSFASRRGGVAPVLRTIMSRVVPPTLRDDSASAMPLGEPAFTDRSSISGVVPGTVLI